MGLVMRAEFNGHGGGAINGADTFVRKTCGTDISVSDDSGWFKRAARGLLAPDRGLALFHITGLGDERQCARYVSGEVKPPGYLVRALLRSIYGEGWLNAIMEGCTAPWWLEHKRAVEVGRKVLALTK